MNESLIKVITPEDAGAEGSEKLLLRLVKLWEKLSATERRRFMRHVEGTTPISLERDVIPTVEAAKLLKVSHARVKQMAESGELKPAKVRRERWTGEVLGYLFSRSDVEALKGTLADTSREASQNRAFERRRDIYERHKMGENFADIARTLNTSEARTRQLFAEYERVQGQLFEVKYILSKPGLAVDGKRMVRQFRAMNIERARELFDRRHNRATQLLSLEPVSDNSTGN